MSTLCYSCGNNPDDIGHEPDCYVPLEEMQKRAERAEAHIAQLEADVGAIRYANAMQERAERAEARIAMLESQEWFVVRSLEADKVRLAATLHDVLALDAAVVIYDEQASRIRARARAALADVGDVLKEEERTLVTESHRWRGGPPMFYELLAILDRLAPQPERT